MMPPLTCPVCAEESPPGKRFCADCGTRLPVWCETCDTWRAATRFCEGCGAHLPGWCASCGVALSPRARHCGECGAIVDVVRDGTAGTPDVNRRPPALDAGREERRLVTALFCDLVGFTPLSERLDAEQVRGIQTRYFESMRAEIERYGGSVEKFAGDAVLALFGVPITRGDDAERAVLCAMAMHEALRSTAGEVQRQYGVELALRVGVNTGEAVSGLRDTAGRRDYSVTGDVVNTAARLQTAAEPGRTVVGEETMRLARKRVRFGERRLLSLKGKARPVAAYGVLGLRDGAGVDDGRLPLLGRAPEMGILLGAWERVRAGEGQFVTLVADAGTGKTRLMNEVVAQSGARVVHGRSASYGHDISLSLVADLLRSVIGVTDAEEVVHVALKLEEATATLLVDSDADALAAARDVFGEVLGIAEIPSPITDAGPQMRRQVLVKSLQLLFRGLSRQPVVLVLDDLHWIDAASAEVLGDVLADAPGLPMLILAAYRPGWIAPWSEWPWVERLNLRPLAEREAMALASRILGGRRLGPALEQYVSERACGNPFFIEELLHVLKETGGVVEAQGHMQLVPTAAARLPTTLTEILLARLDSLDEDMRELVQVAAVIGRTFSIDLLTQVTARARAAVEMGVAALLRAELATSVPSGSGEYGFKHAAMRDVAYNTLLSSRRAALHAAVGRALLEGETDETPEVIAYHFAQTDEHAVAASWLERAGDRSAGMYANEAAIDHYEEARRRLEMVGAVPMMLAQLGEKLAAVFEIVAWYDEALEELAGARNIYRSAGDLEAEARVTAKFSAVQYLRGATMEAFDSARDALAYLDVNEDEGIPSLGLVDLYIALVDPLVALNRFEDALAAAWRALELARLLSEPGLVVRATVRYGVALHGMGRLDEAERVLEDVVAPAEDVGDVASLARALTWLGDICLAQGRPAESCRYYERAMGIEENRGDVAGTAALLGRLGQIAFVAGRWDEARDRFERSVELVRSISFAHFSASALMTLGEHYLREGETEKAARYLEEPMTIAERSGQVSQLPYLQIPLAAWHLQGGHSQEALERLSPLLATRLFETMADHRAMQIAAEAYLQSGDERQASEIVAEGMAFAEGQHNKFALLGWLPLQGSIAEQAGDAAEPHFVAALELARAFPYPYEEARILVRLGVMQEQPRHLEEALTIFRRLGAAIDARRTELALHEMAALDEVSLP